MKRTVVATVKTEREKTPLDIGQIGDATAFVVSKSKMCVRVELNTSEPERLVRAFAGLVAKEDRAIFMAAAKLLAKNPRTSVMTVPAGAGRINLE